MYKKEVNHFIKMILTGTSIAIGVFLIFLTIPFRNFLLFHIGIILIMVGICIFAFSKLFYSQPTEPLKPEKNNNQIDFMKIIEEEENEENSDIDSVVSIISNIYSEDKNE